MNRSLLMALSGIGFVLAGCSLIPEYEQPEKPVPAQWPAGPAYLAPSQQVPVASEIKWREFFRDERLQRLIETALQNNRDLRLAALNVERARALYGIQRAELYPAVGAQGAGGKQRQSVDLMQQGSARTKEQYSVELGIAAWEIDFFGRIRSLSEQALEEYLASEEARRSAQISLIAEVARIYMTLAADRENLQLARSTMEAQQASYALARKRYDIGVTTELDLKQAQIPLDTARRDVAIYTQLEAQDRNALDLLAGIPVPAEWLPPDLGQRCSAQGGYGRAVVRGAITPARHHGRRASPESFLCIDRRGAGRVVPAHHADHFHRHRKQPTLRPVRFGNGHLGLHAPVRHADL